MGEPYSLAGYVTSPALFLTFGHDHFDADVVSEAGEVGGHAARCGRLIRNGCSGRATAATTVAGRLEQVQTELLPAEEWSATAGRMRDTRLRTGVRNGPTCLRSRGQ